jgi:gas vesicle protein
MGKGFLRGGIIGAAIGTVAGVLFAPKPGKETREELKKRADQKKGEAGTQTKEKLAKAEVEARKKVVEGADKLDEVTDKASSAIKRGTSEARTRARKTPTK